MLAWMEEWICGVRNHNEYLEKVGRDRLDRLRQMEHENYRIPRIG